MEEDYDEAEDEDITPPSPTPVSELEDPKVIEVKNIYTYTIEGVKQPPAPTVLFNNINTSEEDVLGDFDYTESLHEIVINSENHRKIYCESDYMRDCDCDL